MHKLREYPIEADEVDKRLGHKNKWHDLDRYKDAILNGPEYREKAVRAQIEGFLETAMERIDQLKCEVERLKNKG